MALIGTVRQVRRFFCLDSVSFRESPRRHQQYYGQCCVWFPFMGNQTCLKHKSGLREGKILLYMIRGVTKNIPPLVSKILKYKGGGDIFAGPQIPKIFSRPSGAMDFPYIKAFISSIEAIFEGFSISRPQGEKILGFWRHFQGDFDDFVKEKSFQILKISQNFLIQNPKIQGGDIFSNSPDTFIKNIAKFNRGCPLFCLHCYNMG